MTVVVFELDAFDALRWLVFATAAVSLKFCWYSVDINGRNSAPLREHLAEERRCRKQRGCDEGWRAGGNAVASSLGWPSTDEGRSGRREYFKRDNDDDDDDGDDDLEHYLLAVAW
ncbi:unnamed protein product [Angiostrongylus costaricensis]|uniref:Uncharacterized protein n=1 Tax=Angiostrongylus costaricensis TaxID=334426 RepID=A0A0R3PC45_ANGCS|nr:unnamed protein product [Angiostrongylus costaricensis]